MGYHAKVNIGSVYRELQVAVNEHGGTRITFKMRDVDAGI